ncbi:5-oxoprolinase/urea amidolyase family protein [Isoptericola jiangsuensis]|uniref:5-oxoprolinase subunit B/C family protein n=1 Tax=Isoptericola jiangsuensis TaxID=548579 RepID=UPI003AAB53E6
MSPVPRPVPTPSALSVRTARDDVLLVEVPDLDAAVRLHRSLRADPVPGTLESVQGARTVLVRFDPVAIHRAALTAALRARAVTPSASVHEGGVVEVPTVYDGEDLPDVARLLGCSVEEVVRRHAAASWTVAFMGFAPGFGYLVGDDPGLAVPRRESPRTRVPQGSVALAGEYAGVYPREGPGGWQLLGRTEVVLWDLGRERPARWAPGDRVRFVAERASVWTSFGSSSFVRQFGLPNEARTAERSHQGSAVDVVDAGLQSLVQDLGRAGRTDLGVTPSGAFDPRSLRAARRAVGDRADAAVVETLGGLRVRAHGHLVVAVAGAPCDLTVHPADGGAARRPTAARPVALAAGDELVVGHPSRGLRAYLAVRGGLLAEPVLGSRSTDVLGRLGPAPLAAGDRIGVGPAPGDAVATTDTGAPDPDLLPAAGEVVHLPVVVGPRDDWFTPAALDTMLGQAWEVTARSDRVGLRLAGAPLERTAAATGRELPSEGCVTGSLQVPPDGRPVVLGPDHPVTGGYPVVGAVAHTHLWMLGQLPPGAHVRFHRATEQRRRPG